ncbi:MAG: large-conductance mechanosensitive channel protein MscL [Eubacteriales bacterium]
MKRRKIISEFKEFISRGNVMDLAVGIIVGSAFTAIVNSLVNDLLMPVMGFLFGGINFENLKFVLKPAVEGVSDEIAIYFGRFLQRTVDFLLIAVVVFMIVKIMNRFRRKKELPKEPEPAKQSDEVVLLTEIRDLLKK